MGSDEKPLSTPEKTSRSRYRSPTEWLSIGVLAAATLAVIGAWGYAAWWIGSTVLNWIK
ncbi:MULTISPECIES: hypothetical protein [unclassified Methylobacterium]|uniref:hypothetical protein n=1 Tax=unclassified Methylobacterium TaxID=2615210 RepID=UPI001FB8EB46|nr:MULTISPECIES: hypothetical protein [unclassified Methylobacterium]MCJ2022536.1 hypothetical protein [Methylobacterium sp. E-065]